MINRLLTFAHQFPEYLPGVYSALAILVIGVPVYLGMRFFVWSRRLRAPFTLDFSVAGVFVLFAGLAFIQTSPLASLLHPAWVTTYLGITCILSAVAVFILVDVFLIQHYLTAIRRIYVSPPLRTVINLTVFFLALLPIFRYVLHFNPLAVIAIPTIATAGIALALQDSLKAFIAGVGLGRIVRVGDWIQVNGQEGQVADINWSRTVLRMTDGNHLYLPNSQLQANSFVNYSAINPAHRLVFNIGISYDVSPTRVKDVLLKCLEGIPGLVTHPKPIVLFQAFGDSSIQYVLHVWMGDFVQRFTIQDEVGTRIWFALRREGIEIPFPIRTVNLRPGANSPSTAAVDLVKTLEQWKFADAFYHEELQELSLFTKARLYAPGEAIVRQGEPGNSLYTVVSGEVEVLSPSDGQTVIATLGRREFFGEMSLLTGAPRSATVRARGVVEALEVDKSGLQPLLTRRPQLSERLAELVAQRQAALTQISAERPSGVAAASAVSGESLSSRIRDFFGLNS